MTMYDRIEGLRKTKKISQGRLEKELGFSNGSVSKWKNSTPTMERMQKLADYFGVSISYLVTGNEEDKEQNLTGEEVIDIAMDMDKYVKLINSQEGVLFFNGKEIDEETKELFLNGLEAALTNIAILKRNK